MQQINATAYALTLGVHLRIDQSPDEALALARDTGELSDAIVSVITMKPGQVEVPVERPLAERSISTNTAAAGGNASLMTLEG